ncbi:MAG: hypothetical protein INR71_05495 [Terriglobus roseus]|nr:hypothetical protein [Terriglobus roseus]
MAELRRKLVIVGDGACGKTCLLMYVVLANHLAFEQHICPHPHGGAGAPAARRAVGCSVC